MSDIREELMARSRRAALAVGVVLAAAAAILTSLALVPTALGAGPICDFGSGAGQCDRAQGVAVDAAAGRLYVADEGNNRIDVFDTGTGAFIEAFGWNVNPGGLEQLEVCTTTCRQGSAGAGAGQFNAPTSIAVDPVSHHLYIAEPSSFRIQKLDPLAGPGDVDFLYMLGGGVDKTVPGNVCTAASGHTCGVGADGTGEGEFTAILSNQIYVSVSTSGTLYVVDNPHTGAQFSEFVYHPRLQRFEPSGTPIAPQRTLFSETGGAYGAAVNSAGDLWVTAFGETADGGHQLRKFKADGTEITDLPSPLPAAGREVKAVAVDEDDNVLVGGQHGLGLPRDITEFDSTGHMQRRFGYGSLSESDGQEHSIMGIAPRPDGTGIYVSQTGLFGVMSGGVTSVDFPPPGPLIFPKPCLANPLGNSKATLHAPVNPAGKATSFHFELVKEETFLEDEAELGAGHGFDHAERVPASASEDPVLPADVELHDAKMTTAAPLTPETEYRCRAVAENADGEATGPEGQFKTLPPLEIGPTWSSGIGFEEATLNAEVNPLDIETSAYFEYVDEETYQKDVAELGPEHGFDHASKAPEGEPLELGSGESFVTASTAISGLAPGTLYRYRVVATDVLISPEGKEVFGPTETLRTLRPPEGILPDDRAYEMVSPLLKNGAEVGIPGAAGGLSNFEREILRVQAAAGSGEAVTYNSWTSFGDAESAPIASQYLSKRSGSGWQTENATPYGFLRNPLHAPYRGFGPELETGGFVVDEPPLTPEAQEGLSNLYLRDNATGTIQALSVEQPDFTPEPNVQGLGAFCTAYAGASKDGRRAFFAANGAMAGAPSGKGFSLYEWSAAEDGLKLVSVLPNGTPATPAVETSFGAAKGRCRMGKSILAHAVSEDGRRAFWTYDGKISGVQKPLLVRVDGERTIQLDAKPASGFGAGPYGQGIFRAATPNGSYAFFSAQGKLTNTAKSEGQLYRYDLAKGEAGEAGALQSITPGTIEPDLSGVIGASEDGKYLYFVAQGVLSADQQGPGGQKAEEGADNLYLWHEGEGLRFIAQLSEFDEEAWSSAPEGLTARVTPDGSHLAFFSVESEALAGYDNTIAEGLHCKQGIGESRETFEGDVHCPQAFLYDAEADTLTCASCNPTGGRPAGPSTIPPWSNPLEGPRYLSDDGSRLFFETFDVLLGADENDQRDIYEFELEGSGSCTEESPTFDPTSGGCHYLISDGRSDRTSFFIYASADGSDVFFATRRRLVGWDEDTNYDVYDARVGGGFPEPPPIPEVCAGEACKPTPAAPPASAPSPGSASFQGPGNPTTTGKPRCRKGKVRRGGRCKPRRSANRGKAKHKRKAHRRKAHGKGRAQR